MILDLRLAAGLPVNAGAVIGFAIGLVHFVRTPRETGIIALLDLRNVGGMVFFAACASLLFVLPNLGAAAICNALAADQPWLVYGLSFAAICVAIIWVQMKLLDKMFRALGGMKTRLTEPRTLALIGGNIALCLLAAAFIPAQDLPHV